jgi:hypothetical protein
VQRYRLGGPVEIRSVGKQVELYKIGHGSHLAWRWRASTRHHAINHDSTKATGLGVEGSGINGAFVVLRRCGLGAPALLSDFSVLAAAQIVGPA